jgi:hypothetical protein
MSQSFSQLSFAGFEAQVHTPPGTQEPGSVDLFENFQLEEVIRLSAGEGEASEGLLGLAGSRVPIPPPALDVPRDVQDTYPESRPFVNNTRARAFVFTFMGYTEEDVQKIKEYPCNYVVFGRETAPSTGRPHLQGYFHFKNPKSMQTLVKSFPGCWFQVAKGSAVQNKRYCSKGGNVFESGNFDLSNVIRNLRF